MALHDELKFRNPIRLLPHEVLLNVYYTASCIKKDASRFFRSFGLTDVQFNLMMLLKYQCASDEGLTQALISDMMLVNRANITTLVDRMVKADLVVRLPDIQDRRANIIRLSPRGRDLLEQVEPRYAEEICRIMAMFSPEEQKKLIALLEQVRGSINN